MSEPTRNDQPPPADAILWMLSRMHNTTAASESKAGAHASSARHEQLGAKYRDAADQARGDR